MNNPPRSRAEAEAYPYHSGPYQKQCCAWAVPGGRQCDSLGGPQHGPDRIYCRQHYQKFCEMLAAEHLAGCKERALEYCDQGKLGLALSSMISDLGKHPMQQALTLDELKRAMAKVIDGDAAAVRQWIEEFQP